jgi:phosphatidylglycerol:prolipoprotein diacylglycerol transferase
MLIHPQIDPVALHLGPISVHWYGLTYLLAFALFYVLATLRLKQAPYSRMSHWQTRDIEDILLWGCWVWC